MSELVCRIFFKDLRQKKIERNKEHEQLCRIFLYISDGGRKGKREKSAKRLAKYCLKICLYLPYSIRF